MLVNERFGGFFFKNEIVFLISLEWFVFFLLLGVLSGYYFVVCEF